MAADFEQVKQNIADTIYENGEELITGQVMQDRLLEMVSVTEEAINDVTIDPTVNVTVNNTTGTPSGSASFQNNQFSFEFSGIKGETGNSGYTGAVGELEVVNNLTSDDATAALSAYQGKVLDGKITQLGQEVDNIVGRDGTIVKGYGIVPNEYVSASDGSLLPYNGWSRTDYVPIGDYSSIEIQGTTTGYNWLYDASKNPVANINLHFGHTINLANYPTAKYIVLSDSSANLANLVITAYGIKGNTLTNLDARVDTLESYDIPAILAELPEGYKLGGIVTPADSPDEDGMEKMFYIAKENGAYTNFGGVVVQDEVAVLYKTEDSANLLHLDTLIPNKYVDAQGNISDASGWTASQKIPVEVGTTYKVVALVNGVWTNMSSIWFALYDAQGGMTHRNVTTLNVLIDTQAGDKSVAVSWDTHTIGDSPMLIPSTLVPTSYIEPNGWHKVTISKLDESSQTEIVLPSKLAFVQDKQFDMMVNNILYRGSAKNVGFKNLGSSTMYAYPYEDRIRINQPNEVISGTAVVRIQSRPDCAFDKNPAEQSDILTKSFTYRSVLKTQGSGVTKKVMFIGDSITANGVYPGEVVNLFANDDMSVQLIGTLGQSPARHEGRGGWSAEDYCTQSSYNTYTNAFYNPTSHKFDFAYYMSENGFSGVDYVFISLGINDVYKQTKPLSEAKYDAIVSYYNEMITSIRAYDSSIKIFVGLPILPANSDWALSYNAEITKAERLGLIQRLIQEYDGRESEGFVLVPLYCVVDTERDFPTESRPICARDVETVEYVTDQTHPKTQGYYKIADVMYTYIKYGTTLS